MLIKFQFKKEKIGIRVAVLWYYILFICQNLNLKLYFGQFWETMTTGVMHWHN